MPWQGLAGRRGGYRFAIRVAFFRSLSRAARLQTECAWYILAAFTKLAMSAVSAK